MMEKYDTIGIDCVAMNVNDMICVGARPLSLVDYIAVDHADAAMLDAIGAGLCKGAGWRVSISGGETSQLKDIVNGFDLVGMAVGRVDLDKVISGKGRARGRHRDRRAQQRHPQQRALARAQARSSRPTATHRPQVRRARHDAGRGVAAPDRHLRAGGAGDPRETSRASRR